MRTKKLFNNTVKIALPLLLGSAILYWMYRGFDFSSIKHVLLHEMNWIWMILSLPFGILAQAFRGWRWKQSLEPIGEHPRASVCVNSIFLSYAVSLLIPRIGEFARCGVLNRYDKVAFPKAIGTVVTERAVDTLIVLLISATAFLMQIRVFTNFFSRTGTRIDDIFGMFSPTGWLVTAICGVASIILFYYVFRHLAFYKKVKEMLGGIWQGISSLRKVKNIPLFIFYSLAIWGSYFSVAVIVPTPNGAGPWHFAVKTMLILYGVADNQALYFVLIVHTIQTLLVILLGVYAWISLSFTKTPVSLGGPAELTRPAK